MTSYNYYLDGKEMVIRKAAFVHIKAALQVDEEYGNNLDALADNLSMLKPNSIIYLTNVESLKENLGEYGERMLEVIEYF